MNNKLSMKDWKRLAGEIRNARMNVADANAHLDSLNNMCENYGHTPAKTGLGAILCSTCKKTLAVTTANLIYCKGS